VVGSGIAGLVSAYLLSKDNVVTLFEKEGMSTKLARTGFLPLGSRANLASLGMGAHEYELKTDNGATFIVDIPHRVINLRFES
jgi:predicted NAD/FAD-binding protein